MKAHVYPGLFAVALATLMYEVLLTRIFSVTMYYHFAFMAISIAMFGMTLGAVIVYLRPERFSRRAAPRQLAVNALLFSVTLILSFLTYLSIPFSNSLDFQSALVLAVCYAIIAIPFVFSGITVTIALTKLPQDVGKLYCADLIGAAAGCVLLIYTLEITDGPTGVFVIGALAASGAFFFALDASRRAKVAALVAVILLAGFAAVHTQMARAGSPLVPIVHRILPPGPILYQRWNSFSFVEVSGDPQREQKPFTWGASSAMPKTLKIRQLGMSIDIHAGTPITSFDGDTRSLEFLKYDVTNMAHYIRRNARVFVIGVGGGRDVLSALAFDQKSVVGVELNENVFRALNQRFGEFSGHLDRHPKVDLVVDEARSYVTRSERKFDIIQLSLIDTFAATAAGAFALAENSVYTTEAWQGFLEHLAPRGILTVSRYYFHRGPYEAYRMAALAVDALRAEGIQNPRDHIVMVKNQSVLILGAAAGIGTLLVSREPFSRADLRKIAQVSNRMRFTTVLSPLAAKDRVLKTIARAQNLEDFYAQYPVDISPPTDDKPFFFQMLRLRDVFWTGAGKGDVGKDEYLRAPVFVLGVLLAIVIVLTVACIFVPLVLTTDRDTVRGSWSLLLFFAAIGFGFMFVEIAQMQRLMVFLGHPTYALSVVLFTLLLSSGLGSLATERLTRFLGVKGLTLTFAALLSVLLISGLGTPLVIEGFSAGQTPTRIAIAATVLAPMGFLMGMPFPLGMRVGSAKSPALLPWLWGINGATSVCCSVVAIAVALTFGITASFWAGVGAYAVAAVAYPFAWRSCAS